MQCSPPTITTPRWPWAGRAREASVFPVIGYDGTQTVQLLMPELATVIQPIEGIAQRAVQRLLELIERQDASSASAAPADSTSEGSAYLPGDVLPIELHLGATVRTIPDLSLVEPDTSAPDELQ